MEAPRSFKAPDGFSRARFVSEPPFKIHRPPTRGARADGVRYEKKVQEYLIKRFPTYYPSPWLEFQMGKTLRYCQPDGLLFDFRRGKIHIFEVKLRHTDKAYWQLERLYRPLLESLFPRNLWQIHTTEVVKWYDPSTPFPVDHALQRDIDNPQVNKLGVHILWPIPKI